MWRWCRTPFAHCAKRTPTFALRCSRGRSSSLSSRGWTSIFWKPTTQAATRGCAGCCVWPARRGGGESTPWPTCTGCCVRASSACCLGCTECRRRASTKGRIEKWFRLGCTNPAASPLKHTVVRYCDVLRRLGFVFDDPQPAAKPVRPNPFGEKKGVWIGFAPFSAQAGKTYPEDLAAELVAGLSRPLRPRLHPQRRRRRSGLRRTYGARTP